MNILLVEDNDVDALILERTLKKHSPVSQDRAGLRRPGSA